MYVCMQVVNRSFMADMMPTHAYTCINMHTHAYTCINMHTHACDVHVGYDA